MDERRRICRTLGQRIIELRRDRELTQEGLAEILQIDARELRRLEAGGNTTVHTLVNLARALNVSITDLFQPPTKPAKRRAGRPKKNVTR